MWGGGRGGERLGETRGVYEGCLGECAWVERDLAWEGAACASAAAAYRSGGDVEFAECAADDAAALPVAVKGTSVQMYAAATCGKV